MQFPIILLFSIYSITSYSKPLKIKIILNYI